MKRIDLMLPASKSISNRALVLNALTGNVLKLENLAQCDDTDVMVAALRDMPYEIDIKAAGTAMRFLTAFLCVREGEHVITGSERMKHRPIRILVDSLRQLGAEVEYVGEEGFPPLRIRGSRIDGGQIKVAGNVSSQYISALLMIGTVMRRGLTLQLTGDIISRPYIDMTLGMMREFGAQAEWTAVDTIQVKPSTPSIPSTPSTLSTPSIPSPPSYHIESDWSAASYFYELVALDDEDTEMRLIGLKDNSLQGDSAVKYIFSLLGVKTAFDTMPDGTASVIIMRKASALARLQFDFRNCPDLAQTIVCTCCGMGIPFDFTGLSTLKIKETDRIEALKTELRKLGFVLNDFDGCRLVWDGSRCQPTMEPINTYEDHRMAMAFAPLVLKHKGLRINNPEVVTKSYPKFWEDFSLCGYSL